MFTKSEGNQVSHAEDQTQFDQYDAIPRQDLIQQEQVVLMKQYNEILQKTLQLEREEKEAKKAIALVKAKNRCKWIKKRIDDLGHKVHEVDIEDGWKDESDLSITTAMVEIENWKKDLEEIESIKEDLDDILAKHNLKEDLEISATQVFVEKMADDVKIAVGNIKAEDKSRELYSLAAAPRDKAKFPTFEGRDDEDFAKFKLEIERAFVKNRVAKDDKLGKLREVLKGHAKNLVPENYTDDIDKAWDILNKSFGNPMRLLNYKKDTLLKLGPLPKLNRKGGVRAQVEWYVQVECLVKDIIYLGGKSTKLEREAFSDSTINGIKKLFPLALGEILNQCSGDGSDKMEAILQKITEFRITAQEAQFVYDVPLLTKLADKRDDSETEVHSMASPYGLH